MLNTTENKMTENKMTENILNTGDVVDNDDSSDRTKRYKQDKQDTTCKNCRLLEGRSTCICVKCTCCGIEKNLGTVNCPICILDRITPYKNDDNNPHNETSISVRERTRLRAILALLNGKNTF